MKIGQWRLFAALVTAATGSLLTSGPATADAPAASVTVMTRNLYLGADLLPAVAAGSVQELIDAASAIFSSVQQTNFHERAQAIADEIAATQPDLVGLQEVALWRSAYPATGSSTPTATHVEYDFLADLLDALEQRGLHYAAATVRRDSSVLTETDVQAPADAPGRHCTYPEGFVLGNCQDIRFTDRDAILVHVDPPGPRFAVTDVQTQTFANNLRIPIVGGVFQARRGFVAVDLLIGGRPFRIVSTHLEPDSEAIRQLQAAEVASGPASTGVPVLFVCDCNSPPVGSGSATYADLISYGFTDAWVTKYPNAPGYTCCQAGDLLNGTSLLDQRIDLVLFRGGRFEVDDMLIVGALPSDKTASGLWPSDHAGVVGELRFEDGE